MADDVVTVQTIPAPPDIQEQLDVPTGGELTDEQREFLGLFQTPAAEDTPDVAPAPAPAPAAAPAPTPAPEYDPTAPPKVPVIPKPDYTQIAPEENVEPEPELPPEMLADKKAAHAFATMRARNAELQTKMEGFNNLLEEVATMLNIPKELPIDKKAEATKEAILAYRAHKDGIPVEVVQRLSALEARERNYFQKELELYNIEAFGALKHAYNLTDTEVELFQQELLSNGIDYGKEKILVSAAYRDMHEQDILEKQVAARVAEELSKKNKVEQHATTPNKYVSAEAPLTENAAAMQTIGDLEAWMRKNVGSI